MRRVIFVTRLGPFWAKMPFLLYTNALFYNHIVIPIRLPGMAAILVLFQVGRNSEPADVALVRQSTIFESDSRLELLEPS